MTKQSCEITVKTDTREYEGMIFTYSLTVSESPYVSSFKLPLYSIEVELTHTDGKVTRSVCKDAFADIGKALIFYGKIVNGLVTPIDLAYVYEDEIK